MLKVLKGFVYLMATVGFLAVGYLIWQGFQRVKESAVIPGMPPAANSTAAATPAPTPNVKLPANPELASIVQSYQQKAAAENKPAEGAATGAGAAGGTGSYAASLANKPVRTPGPTEKIIRQWPTGRKWIALTYDDGPHPEHTPKLMDLLKSKGVKATFFVIGPMVEKSPEVAKALAEAGFEIGNHTMTHPQFRGASQDKVREELENTNRIVKEVAGVEPKVMRPPYGQAPKAVQEVTDQLGLKIVTWNIDTEDWKRATEDDMRNNIMKNLGDGAIVLMHDVKGEKVLNATAKVIDEIRAKGYEFVTVSELLGLQPHTPAAAAAPAPAAAQAAAPAAAAPAPAAAAATPAPQAAPAAPAASQDAAGLPAPASGERKLPEVSPDKLTTPTAR